MFKSLKRTKPLKKDIRIIHLEIKIYFTCGETKSIICVCVGSACVYVCVCACVLLY